MRKKTIFVPVHDITLSYEKTRKNLIVKSHTLDNKKNAEEIFIFLKIHEEKMRKKCFIEFISSAQIH